MQVKYTLKKLEQIIYELTLASSGFVPKSGLEEPSPEAIAAAEGTADGGAGDAPGAEDGGDARGGRGGKRPRNA